MSAKMSPKQLRTWETLQVTIDELRREVGRDLWNDAQLSEAEFTVIAHLYQGGDDGVRPAQCARAIGWESSRLAHQLRRLEKRGLVVTRPADSGDARATIARLTPAGRDTYRRALGPHLASARRWFADALTADELDAFERTLNTVLRHVRSLSAPSTATQTRNA